MIMFQVPYLLGLLIMFGLATTSCLPALQNVTTSYSAGKAAKCISGNIAIPISAVNVKLALEEPANQTVVTELIQELFQNNSTITDKFHGPQPITGTFSIDFTLCAPQSAKTPQDLQTLQVLTHGVGLDKSYWDIAEGYSHIDAAAKAGYATLAYNRLGVGGSDHPDPLQTVQAAVDVEILHGLIKMATDGCGMPYRFRQTIGVGHSYGSIVQLAHNAKYPNETAATVLTGFTNGLVNLPLTILANNPAIAALNDPARFGTLPYGYLVHNDPISFQLPFFRFPYFSDNIFQSQYAAKNTYTLGQELTIASIVAPAPAYRGPVDIVVGINDFPFCRGDCSYPTDQAAATLAAFYPHAASGSTSYLVPRAGHVTNAHYGAADQFAQINRFLSGNGFGAAQA